MFSCLWQMMLLCEISLLDCPWKIGKFCQSWRMILKVCSSDFNYHPCQSFLFMGTTVTVTWSSHSWQQTSHSTGQLPLLGWNKVGGCRPWDPSTGLQHQLHCSRGKNKKNCVSRAGVRPPKHRLLSLIHFILTTIIALAVTSSRQK